MDGSWLVFSLRVTLFIWRKSIVMRYRDLPDGFESISGKGCVSILVTLFCFCKYLSALVSQRCSLTWLRRTKVIFEQYLSLPPFE